MFTISVNLACSVKKQILELEYWIATWHFPLLSLWTKEMQADMWPLHMKWTRVCLLQSDRIYWEPWLTRLAQGCWCSRVWGWTFVNFAKLIMVLWICVILLLGSSCLLYNILGHEFILFNIIFPFLVRVNFVNLLNWKMPR